MRGLFNPGEEKTRPGTYFRTVNSGARIGTASALLIVAAVFQADWGPLGSGVLIEKDTDVDAYFSGSNSGIIDTIRNLGADVFAIRAGSGGVAATTMLVDTATPTPAAVVSLTAKYPGTRPLSVTIRDSLTDNTMRELLVYSGTALKEIIRFTKGAGGAGEPAALIAAISANSKWLTASEGATEDGNKVLAVVSQLPLQDGANPTIDNDSYSDAFTAIEMSKWHILTVDTNDTDVHALVSGYVDRLYEEGKLRMGVIGEPSSVDFSTRLADCAEYNNFRMVYVINGIADANGNAYEGWDAAAIVAGLISASKTNTKIGSTTHKVPDGYTAVSEVLVNQQIKQAITSGAVCFSTNANGLPQLDYGITTFTTPNDDYDAGYKKIKRVLIRFDLLDRIDVKTDALVGEVDKNADGISAVIAAAQSVIDDMADEEKIEAGGTIMLDPEHSPEGDSAWFIIAVDDIDSLEKMYFTYNFRFSPGL